MDYEICYDGGLGDFFVRMFEGTGYANLNNLKHGDTCKIHIVSHNPFCKEIWEWHPKRSQLELIVHPWQQVRHNHEIRTRNNIPMQDFYPQPCSDKPEIYPSPEDEQVLDVMKKLDKLRPFVIISAVAGSASRNISQEALEQMVPYIQNKGYDVVAIGRSYKRIDGSEEEDVFSFNKSVISLVDKLTIPGTVKLIEQCAGIICCHSAIVLANWFLYRKPNLVFYPMKIVKEPEQVGIKDGKEIKLDTEECYSFGRKFPETQVAFNEKFNLSILEKML